MHGGELGHIETVGKHTVGLALEEMLAFVCGDVRDGREDIAGMSSCALDAVTMIDPTLASLRIHIKVL